MRITYLDVTRLESGFEPPYLQMSSMEMITISLLCENIDILLPTITNIFIDILTTDIVPLDF